jgi:hypothetical protein
MTFSGIAIKSSSVKISPAPKAEGPWGAGGSKPGRFGRSKSFLDLLLDAARSLYRLNCDEVRRPRAGSAHGTNCSRTGIVAKCPNKKSGSGERKGSMRRRLARRCSVRFQKEWTPPYPICCDVRTLQVFLGITAKAQQRNKSLPRLWNRVTCTAF